jgi:hypothetical protein
LIQIVHEHASGGFLRPRFAGDVMAPRSLQRRQVRGLDFSIDRPNLMVANWGKKILSRELTRMNTNYFGVFSCRSALITAETADHMDARPIT